MDPSRVKFDDPGVLKCLGYFYMYVRTFPAKFALRDSYGTDLCEGVTVALFEMNSHS